jgi:4-amino-4-deoxy-L-arabinose transferase-like glycosyltransferase
MTVVEHEGKTGDRLSTARRVWLRRLALTAIAALAGLLYAWAMGRETLEYYYAAADRSMSMSWHNFFFGAFDPAGTITVDKLPGALWLQALSVRAFGVHAWAIVLPQVIEGIATVLVLYRAVRRLAGPDAGLIAALLLAVSPVTVALNRENISHSLLILLLVLAADAVSAAIAGQSAHSAASSPARGTGQPGGLPSGAGSPRRAAGQRVPAASRGAGDTGPPRDDAAGAGRRRRTWGWLILAGVWVGLAFQAKEIEAWMVVPALGLAYLVSGPGPVLRRAGQLAVCAVILTVVSLSWITAVSLVPAAHRPYVDGSHDNSAFEQVFSYNGFGRFGDQTPVQVRAEQLNPGVPVLQAHRAADRLLQSGLGDDTGWLMPAAAVVAVWGLVSRRRQPRGDPLRACFLLWGGWLLTFFAVFSVVTVLRPYYTAALAPPAAAIIGAGFAAARSRNPAPVSWTIGLAVTVAGTAAYAAWLVSSAARAPGWLLAAVIVAGIAAVGLILWPLAGLRSVPFDAALLAGLAAMSLAPAVAGVSVTAEGQGAFDTPFEPAQVQNAIAVSAGKQAIIAVPHLISRWQDIENGAPYLLAAQSIGLPSVVIYDTGLEALPIGGYDGTTPSPTLAQLQADIRHSLFRLVWINSAASDPRLRWIAAHCTQLSGPPGAVVQPAPAPGPFGVAPEPGSEPAEGTGPQPSASPGSPGGAGSPGPPGQTGAATFECGPADAG